MTEGEDGYGGSWGEGLLYHRQIKNYAKAISFILNGQTNNGLYTFHELVCKESFFNLMLMCGRELALQISGNKTGISISLNNTSTNNTTTTS